MFPSLRVTSYALQSSWRPSASRAFSATSLRHAQLETDAAESWQPEEDTETTYKVFMEKIGVQYEKVNKTNNWLHPKRPFPMNQSFVPPPPVSDALRESIWEEFVEDPHTNNLRTLSEKHGLSLKRIDAILRLKGLESAWKEGKPLQTGFRIGMEKILGVSEKRRNAHKADMLEQDENRDSTRQRYQRLYWESVPIEGQEPITPLSLENAKKTAKQFSDQIEEAKSGSVLMPLVPDTQSIMRPKQKTWHVTKEGRPTLQFTDVGGKFVDVDESVRRIAVAQRRANIKKAKKDDSKL